MASTTKKPLQWADTSVRYKSFHHREHENCIKDQNKLGVSFVLSAEIIPNLSFEKHNKIRQLQPRAPYLDSCASGKQYCSGVLELPGILQLRRSGGYEKWLHTVGGKDKGDERMLAS
jgi:hypothetical protein